jgi:hypothetical protein
MMKQIILVFVSFTLTFTTDAIWTLYIRSAASNRAMVASIASAFIILVSGIGVLILVHNTFMLIPQALGGFLGTYAMMKWDNKDHRTGSSGDQKTG